MTAAPFGDPVLNAWILGWGADRLAHGFAGLWTAPLFYPYPDTLAYSEHLLGISIPLAPLQWATGNPVLVYNVAFIASFALSGAGMYLLARELTGRRDAAFLAGLAFMWCPYRAPQMTHLQVLTSGWMPVALWGLHRYFRTGSRWALTTFVLAFLLQGLSNGYFLFFLAVPVVLVSAVELVRARGRVLAHLAHLLVAAAIIGLVMAPVAAAYLRVKREQGLSRSRGDAVQFSAMPADYAHVSHHPRLWARFLPIGEPEKELFPGLVVLLLALCTLLSARAPAAQRPPPLIPARQTLVLYTAIAAAGFILSLGPEPAVWRGTRLPTGPYGWLMAIVPGFDGLRVPSRFATVVYLALAVLAAAGATRLLTRLATWPARAVTVLLGLAIVGEGYAGPLALERMPSADMAVDRAAYGWLRLQPRGPMVELPIGEPDPGVRYLYRTLVHGNRIVNGYSGYGSALQDFMGGPPFNEIERIGDALAMCRALRLRYIVVHGQLYRDAEYARRLTDAIRAQGEHVLRSIDFGPVTVFELREMTVHAPSRPTGSEIVPASFSLSASHNAERILAAADGQAGTRWVSGMPQNGTEWIRVDFDRVRRPTFVRLVMDRRSFADYPRGLDVEGSVDGNVFTPLAQGPVVTPFALSLIERPFEPRIDRALPRMDVRALRLRQTGRTPRQWYWSVHEIRLFE
jgi:F5/8 type C domain